MSWHNPVRAQESMEDRDLREELSQLLGLPRREFFEVEVSPRMIALAEDLRREASRRRNTTRQRPMWLLLAAALPVAMTLGALGSWGYQHKQRAEALAAAVTAKEIAIQQMAQTAAVAAAQLKASQAPVAPVAATSTATPSPTRVARVKPRPGELVIEVKPSTSSMPTQTQTVKQRGQ